MKTDITQAILTAVQILPWTAIAGVAIKWWTHSRYSRYIPIVKTAVQYAEQVLVKSTGNDKRIWVENYISQKLNDKLTQDEIEKLIESAVLEMNTLLKPISSEDAKSSGPSKEVQPLITKELIDEIAKETAENLAKKINAV